MSAIEGDAMAPKGDVRIIITRPDGTTRETTLGDIRLEPGETMTATRDGMPVFLDVREDV